MTVAVDAFISDAIEGIADIDILVVPGGLPSLLQESASEKKPVYQFVKYSVDMQQRGAEKRVLLSVRTGALLVAVVGSFEGLKFYHPLEEMDGDIDVVNSLDSDGTRRYVDRGLKKDGLRVVSAGGVSCGMDAALQRWGAESGMGSCGVCCEDG